MLFLKGAPFAPKHLIKFSGNAKSPTVMGLIAEQVGEGHVNCVAPLKQPIRFSPLCGGFG